MAGRLARKFRVCPVQTKHVFAVIEGMRDADREEVMASGGFSPAEAVEESLSGSEYAWALEVEGETLAIFGIADLRMGTLLSPGPGVIWLLGTRAIDRHKREFVRASRAILPELLEISPVLANAVDARYRQAIRWLRWLGFHVAEAEPFGKAGLPFHFVSIRRQEAACVSP